MEDLISRQSALDVLDDFQSNIELGIDDYAEKRKALCDLPSADRPSGEWVELGQNKDGTHSICCGACGVGKYKSKGHARSYYTREKYKYCPHCGADMRGGNDEIR